MDAKQLKEMLSYIPDSAKVYSYADHGQHPEQVGAISVTSDPNLEYYGDDINWLSVKKRRL